MSVARGMSPVRSRIITFDARLKSERDYWLKKLSREIGPSNLRPDFERPATYAAEKNRVAVSVSEALCQKLDKLTKGSDFLLYAALHAALKVCLHKYTASNYIAIGSPARLKEQASNMPGNAL